MEKFLKIDNIMFYVKDLEKSAKFYEDVLGMKRAWADKKNKMIGFVFEKSDSEIVVHSNPDMPNPDFSFLVNDVVKFVAKYEKLGYRIVKKPFSVRCGKFAVIKDIDGNALPIVDLTKFRGKSKYNHL